MNGLCFQCGEKFNPGHKCKLPASPELNFIAVEDGGDGGIILSEDILDVLESPAPVRSPDDVFVSLNAISRVEKQRLIKFRSLVSNQVVLQLLDIDGSHTFRNANLVDKVPCTVVDIEPVEVKVENR